MPPQGTKARGGKPGRKPKSEESTTKKQTGGRKQQMPKNASSRGGKTQGTRQSGKKAGGKGQKKQTKNGASSSKRGKRKLTFTERLDLLINDNKLIPVMEDFNRKCRHDLEAILKKLNEKIRPYNVKPGRCKKAAQRGTARVKSGTIWRTSYLRKLPKPIKDKPRFGEKFWEFITGTGLIPRDNCTLKKTYKFSTGTLLRSLKKKAPKIKERFPKIEREKPYFDASFWGYVTESDLIPVYGSAVNKTFLAAVRDSFHNMRNAEALEVIREEGEKIVYGSKSNETITNSENLLKVPRKS